MLFPGQDAKWWGKEWNKTADSWKETLAFGYQQLIYRVTPFKKQNAGKCDDIEAV